MLGLPFRAPGLLLLSLAYSGLLYAASQQAGFLDVGNPYWVLSVAALLLLSPIYHALVLPGIRAALCSQRAGWRKVTQDAVGLFVPLFIGEILVGIGVLVGALLLIIPGVFVGMRLIYYKQSIVLDKAAVNMAMRESLQLSRDVRSTFLLFLALAVLYGAAVGLDTLLALYVSSGAAHVAAVVVTALLILWMNVLVTAAYLERRAAPASA